MAGTSVNSASHVSVNLPRRPPRHSRNQTPRRQHYTRGVPPFSGDNGRSRLSRSLPRASWGDGATPYETNEPPPFHAENSRTYSNHRSNNNSHQQYHNGNGRQPSTRVWWAPFSSLDHAPPSLLPRECTTCKVTPSTVWGMVEHFCQIEHCENVLAHRQAELERHGRGGPRLMCELCRVSLPNIQTTWHHFAGSKHRNNLQSIKLDLRNSGCTDVPNDSASDNRSDGVSGRSSSRGDSIEENTQDDEDQNRSPKPEATDEGDRKRRESKTSNELMSTKLLQQPPQSTCTNSDTNNKDRWKQPALMSIRSPNSLKDELDVLLKETDDEGRKCAESGSGKDFRKHQYFLSSEEERSDDESAFRNTNQENGQRIATSLAEDPRTPEARPKVPRPLVGSTGKSLVDKRKDILSKLSNCTDVRDLAKQLRQIGRGADEKQKTARKRLPGVAYTNRDIEKQETFGEARAKQVIPETAITIEEPESVCLKRESPKDISGVFGTGTQASSPTKLRVKNENNEDCAIVAAPPAPPPQMISDSEEGEQEQPPQDMSPRLASSTSQYSHVQPPAGPQVLPNDDIVRLAALTSEETAGQERLRYLSHTLPRVEALLGFLRQEEQATIAQLELIRAAKNRIATAVGQGPQPPQGAEIFGPSQILNAILHPAPRNPDNLAWLFNNTRPQRTSINYNLQNVLGSLGAASSPVTSLAPAPLFNGVINDSINGSFDHTTPQSATSLDTRKRSNVSPGVWAKRSKSAEVQLDEQLHSEQVLAVKLSGDFVYSSSRDGVVKRTPLSDGGGSVVIYRHCGQDSNSNLKRVCAYMLEISVHKKMQIVKLLTGSDDCALRVFDGDSGHLMKVIPVQARVLCGFIAWQKIYIGLKSGYIQVYNLLDQRFIVESEVRQVPKFVAATQVTSSKHIVVVTQDNAMMLRDAGTLFLLYAVDKRDQKITGLIVRDENILLAGESKVYVFDKGGRLCREVELDEEIFGAVMFESCLFVASVAGSLNGLKWKELIGGQVQRKSQLSWTAAFATVAASKPSTSAASADSNAAEVLVALHCDEGSKRLAIATESGRVAVFDAGLASTSDTDNDENPNS